jgi:integrase
MKLDDEDEIISFSNEEMVLLDEYFKGAHGETAYPIGKNCGLRINGRYGLKWSDLDFENDCIYIQRQMQYQEGLYKMTSLKTRNARRTVYMNSELKKHLLSVKSEVEESSKKIPKIRNQNQTIIIDANGKPL